MYGYGAGSAAAGQSTAWVFLVIVAVIVLRVVRSGRQRPVRPLMLLVTSALVLYGSYTLLEFGSGAAAGVSAPRPTGVAAALPFYAVGALLGLAIGFFRGRTISFFRDAATGQVLQKSGPWAILIWVGLFALRYLVRYLAGHDLIGAWATPASDILLLLGACSVLGRNLYSLLRYMQLRQGSLAAIG